MVTEHGYPRISQRIVKQIVRSSMNSFLSSWRKSSKLAIDLTPAHSLTHSARDCRCCVPYIQEQTVEVKRLKNCVALEQELAAKLVKGCNSQFLERVQHQKSKAVEPFAIHKIIKLLNDDDALQLCRATLLQKEQGDDVSLQAHCLESFDKTEQNTLEVSHSR